MIRYLTTAILALVISVTAVRADSTKAIFRGKYDGIADLQNVVGDRQFYSPVRFNISKTGVITGTAYFSDTKKLYKVKGSIGKVTSMFGIRFIGKASGTFSDGTKWTANVEAQKGVAGKIVQGKARKGKYSGSLTLTDL